MELPNVYVVFEQKGDGPIVMRNAADNEKEAEGMRRYYDSEPKSGRIFVEVYGPLESKQSNMGKYLTCEDCSCTNDTVKEVNCPFAEEVHGKEVKVTICKDCYYERLMEI